MIQNFYIQAAIELGLIEKNSGIGLEEGQITIPNKSPILITESIKQKASHLYVLSEVRKVRDSLLQQTDWIGLSDIPDTELKTELISYRQKLRDITKTISETQNIQDVVYPKDPRIQLYK